MLHDIVDRKVDESQVGLFIRLHQPLAQVIDGGKALVVVVNREVGAVEDGVAFHESRHVEPREELGVNLIHLGFEETLQKIEAPATADVAAALPTVDARLRGGLCAVEEPAAPGGLLLEVKELAVLVDHGPAHGARAHVEADAIASVEVSEIHDGTSHRSWYILDVFRLPVGSTLRVKIRLCQKCLRAPRRWQFDFAGRLLREAPLFLG